MSQREKIYEPLDEVRIDPGEPVFTSGVVSRLLNIPVWVLKQLDAEGIVSPSRESSAHTRLYSMNELKLLQYCWRYINDHKVKVPGLKIILRLELR